MSHLSHTEFRQGSPIALARIVGGRSAETCGKVEVLAYYQDLLSGEEAFGPLKSYLEGRPIFHRRPDRVGNQGGFVSSPTVERTVGEPVAGQRGEWRGSPDPAPAPKHPN